MIDTLYRVRCDDCAGMLGNDGADGVTTRDANEAAVFDTQTAAANVARGRHWTVWESFNKDSTTSVAGVQCPDCRPRRAG